MPRKLNVMVVDDTIIYRKILSDVVSSLDEVEAVSSAPNGELALRKIKLNQPDFVILDIEMPGMNGLETLKAIKRDYPAIQAMMISGVNERDAEVTVQALEEGAVDFVPKPSGKSFQENFDHLRVSIGPIISMVARQRGGGEPAPAPRPEPVRLAPRTLAPTPKRFDLLVIGVSTGGPNALASFIPSLPGDLGVPVLIVQHMPPMFTKSLASHLERKAAMPVTEATQSEPLQKNRVYIAPGGKHLELHRDGALHKLVITDKPPVNSCKPSVDVLFESVARYWHGNVLSIILTGMGNDGMRGVQKLKQSGCYSITQSENSCVVYGMPRAVDEAGLSDESIHLDKMANRVTLLIQRGLTS